MSLAMMCKAGNYEEVFKQIDTDGNGTLEPIELQAALKTSDSAGIEPPMIDVRKMIAKMKPGLKDKSDEELMEMSEADLKVTLDEFKIIMEEAVAQMNKDLEERIEALAPAATPAAS